MRRDGACNMVINVLYEDNHVIVVEKKVNIPVQADISGDEDMLTILKSYIKEKYNKPGDVFLGLVHRLDRPVGGVMVFARTSKAASRLTDAFRTHSVKKRYIAIVDGEYPGIETLQNHIVKDERAGTARIAHADESGAKAAKLMVTPIANKAKTTLVDVDLFTGRKHQIRLQLSNRGFAIANDARYNPRAKAGNQIALHAYCLAFTHPTKKEEMTFYSLPKTKEWANYVDAIAALPLREKCVPVYADERVICVAKENGVEVSEADGGESSLETTLRAHYGQAYPVHRIDANTRGLVLFARDEKTQAALESAFSSGEVEKHYRAKVSPPPKKSAAILEAHLKKDAARSTVHVTSSPIEGSKPIKTGYKVLASNDDFAVLDVRLYTGRTHQIRAHLAFIGSPIIGDDKYGDRENNKKHKARTQELVAHSLTFHVDERSELGYLSGKTFRCPF